MKLKPCPFCGKEPEVIKIWVSDSLHESGYSWIVRCNYLKGGCGAQGGSRTKKEEAIEIWNRRTE